MKDVLRPQLNVHCTPYTLQHTATLCNTLQHTATQCQQATREKDMLRQQLNMHEEKRIKDSDEVQELQLRLAKSTEAVHFSDQVCCSAVQCGLQWVAVFGSVCVAVCLANCTESVHSSDQV